MLYITDHSDSVNNSFTMKCCRSIFHTCRVEQLDYVGNSFLSVAIMSVVVLICDSISDSVFRESLELI